MVGRRRRQDADRHRPPAVRVRRLPAVGHRHRDRPSTELARERVRGVARRYPSRPPPTTRRPTPVDTVPVDTLPTDPVPVDRPTPDPVATLPPVIEGDPIARIELPRIGVDKIVVAGVDKNDLKKGPGHYPETPLPGQLGNSAIAGHRTTFGQPFFDVDKLRERRRDHRHDAGRALRVPGDRAADRVAQRLSGDFDDRPDSGDADVDVVPSEVHRPGTDHRLRRARRGGDRQASSATPTINYGRPLDAAVTADPDPTNTVVDPEATAPDDAAAETDSADRALRQRMVDDPTLTDDPASVDDEQINDGIADAFSEGWFSDPGANGQVALWGLLLAAIGIGSYLLSRKAKRDWVGLLVGIVPFVTDALLLLPERQPAPAAEPLSQRSRRPVTTLFRPGSPTREVRAPLVEERGPALLGVGARPRRTARHFERLRRARVRLRRARGRACGRRW